jgi:hypothetical protein
MSWRILALYSYSLRITSYHPTLTNRWAEWAWPSCHTLLKFTLLSSIIYRWRAVCITALSMAVHMTNSAMKITWHCYRYCPRTIGFQDRCSWWSWLWKSQCNVNKTILSFISVSDICYSSPGFVTEAINYFKCPIVRTIPFCKTG